MTEGDRAISQNVSSQIRQAQTLEALNKASLAVQQARTPDEVYQAVTEEMAALGYRTIILTLSFDEKHLHVKQMAVAAETLDRVQEVLGRPITGLQIPWNLIECCAQVIERRETLFVPDRKSLICTTLPEASWAQAEQVAEMLSLRRAILAPLVVVGQSRGILLVSADTLTAADLPAVTAFAAQISAALERARLFAELQEREWRATIAYEMAQQYAQELQEMVRDEQQRRAEMDHLNKALRLFADQLQDHQDETAIAQLLCETVCNALGWKRAVVSLRDYRTLTSRPVAQVGFPPEIAQQQIAMLLTPLGQAGWMRDEFRVSHSYYVPDVPALLDLDKEQRITDSQEEGQPPYLLVVPLEAGGHILGVLSPTDREDQQRPTRQQIEYLELFAAQAAIAIESIRLSKSVQIWADAVRHSGDAIFIADVEGRILSANPAFEALTGHKLTEATGQAVHILDSSPAQPAVYEKLWRTIQAGQTWRGEVIGLRQDGSAYDADLTVAPILGPGGEIMGFVGSQRDITATKELDRLKSQFVANISHELRTPLTNIKLYQRYLRQDRRPNLRDRFFDILEQETKRLEQIIESLLDLSRLETGIRPFQAKAVDLNEVAGSVVQEYLPVAESRHIALVFEPSPELPQVMADRQQMAVVLGHLLSNALNYTTVGSIRVITHTDHGRVQLEVHDTGCGMAPEETARIFDKFYRGQASLIRGIAGAGLGLSIARQILDLHQGTIEVSSQQGQGSVFTITLPALAPQAGSTSPDTGR